MNARPPVSVIVSAYTEERWDDLGRAVRSLWEQSGGAPQVVVVVDHNASLLRRASAALDGALVVPNCEPPGLSGARNSGIAAARGRVLAFLDDDARAEPDWLERLLEPYDDGRVIGVGGRIEPDWDGGRPAYLPEEFDWVVGCTYRGMPTERTSVRNVLGANMSFRREAFEAVGGFLEEMGRLGARCDDTEMCIRIRTRLPGRAIVYEPRAMVRHHVPRVRARPRYFFTRCFVEGESKARVARVAGPAAALETERRYMARVLPAGVARGLAGAARGHLSGLAKAAMIVSGAGVAAAGYVHEGRRRARR
jgi:glycosyltransferase involved in cell wall biosynthesis